MPDAHALCLYAVADGLRQRAREAAHAARRPEASAADRARALALFEVVGLVLHEAGEVDLGPADVGLGGFDPDLDVLGPT